MKIGIIQGPFFPVPPVRGGAVEKLWHRLGIEFARQGHEVVHISRLCDGLPPSNVESGVKNLRVPGFDQPASGTAMKVRDFQYALRATRALPKGTEIVVTNSFWSPLLLRNHPGVCVSVERMPKGQMWLYRRAARLVACSTAVQEAILRERPRAAPQIRVIPNPLPVDPDRDVNWGAKAQRILYVGRIHPEKGIALLLEAFTGAKSRNELAGWNLELVGPTSSGRGGGGDAWAEALAQRYRHPDITWRAAVYDPNALNALYESSAVFVYPSLAEKGETFGLAPLEAMAWGSCPVVSDLACFRDFVKHGQNGLIFDHRGSQPAGALAHGLDEATRRWAALGKEAVSVRQTHAAPKIAAQFLEDFERTLRERRRFEPR